MLIPLKDENPLRFIGFAYVTVALIAACVLTYLWQVSLGPAQERMILALGAIPAVITGEKALPAGLAVVPAHVTLVTSMFLHGSWLHLGGNMLFLWIFGDNVEDAMGHVRFLIFYLVCGIVAALAHVAAGPDSQIPTVGASGAISGVLGAYLVLHPRAQVLTLFFRFFITLPAFVVATRSGPDGVILPPSAILLRTGAYPAGFCHIQRKLDSEQQSFARCLSFRYSLIWGKLDYLTGDPPEMLRSLCVALVVALMTACSAQVNGPSVKVKPATVEIGPDNDGDFCPPGQAKKGRC